MTDEILPAVIQAAAWLATQPSPPSPMVPLLKERFRLNSLQACQAIALARKVPAPKEGESDGQ